MIWNQDCQKECLYFCRLHKKKQRKIRCNLWLGNIVCEIKAIVEGKRNERLNTRLKSQGEEHKKKIKFLSSTRIWAQDVSRSDM